jgi:hypothetical protein
MKNDPQIAEVAPAPTPMRKVRTGVRAGTSTTDVVANKSKVTQKTADQLATYIRG